MTTETARSGWLTLLRERLPGPVAAAGAWMANPHPGPSKAATDRAALLADISARRRRAQIAARHALDAPGMARVDAALAS